MFLSQKKVVYLHPVKRVKVRNVNANVLVHGVAGEYFVQATADQAFASLGVEVGTENGVPFLITPNGLRVVADTFDELWVAFAKNYRIPQDVKKFFTPVGSRARFLFDGGNEEALTGKLGLERMLTESRKLRTYSGLMDRLTKYGQRGFLDDTTVTKFDMVPDVPIYHPGSGDVHGRTLLYHTNVERIDPLYNGEKVTARTPVPWQPVIVSDISYGDREGMTAKHMPWGFFERCIAEGKKVFLKCNVMSPPPFPHRVAKKPKPHNMELIVEAGPDVIGFPDYGQIKSDILEANKERNALCWDKKVNEIERPRAKILHLINTPYPLLGRPKARVGKFQIAGSIKRPLNKSEARRAFVVARPVRSPHIKLGVLSEALGILKDNVRRREVFVIDALDLESIDAYGQFEMGHFKYALIFAFGDNLMALDGTRFQIRPTSDMVWNSLQRMQRYLVEELV